MPSTLEVIDSLLAKHYAEAAEGIVDKPVSRLLRGEATEKNFYILKIDLVGSTQLLLQRRRSTYLKFAHTFLSTLDKITQECGADPEQIEYAGDSVLAYFPDSCTAEAVIRAACHARAAVQRMQRLDGALGTMRLRCKAVLHYDGLLVSRIGPRANTVLTAIGYPLHTVAKLEKSINADTGRATQKFFAQVHRDARKFLLPVYEEKQVPIPPAVQPISTLPAVRGLAQFINNQPPPNPFSQMFIEGPQYRIEKSIIGYDLDWPALFRVLKLDAPIQAEAIKRLLGL